MQKTTREKTITTEKK